MLIVRHESDLMAKSAHIIKALYDLDIIEEEAILAWGEKPSSKYVNKNKAKEIIDVCAPVITWLKEAEEESDDDESEHDDIEVYLVWFLLFLMISVRKRTPWYQFGYARRSHRDWRP